MARSFSRQRREMILLPILSDFLYQKTALLGERQHPSDSRDDDRHLDRTCGQLATLIRHPCLEASSVRALAISVIQPAFGTVLVQTIRRSTLLETAALLARLAAVALTSIARATDVKHLTTSVVVAKPLS